MSSNHVHRDDHHRIDQHSRPLTRPEINAFHGQFPNHAYLQGAWSSQQQASLSSQWWQQQQQQQQQHQQPTGHLPAALDPNSPFHYGSDLAAASASYDSRGFVHHGDLSHEFQQNTLDPALMSAAAVRHSHFDNTPNFLTPTILASSTAQHAVQPSQCLSNAPGAAHASLSPAVPSSSKEPVSTLCAVQHAREPDKNASRQQPLSDIPPPSKSAHLPPPPTAYPKAPVGKPLGKFLVMDENDLTTATNSSRVQEYLWIGPNPIKMPIMKSTLPPYVARKSRNELKRLSAADGKLTAKIARASKKAKIPATSTVRYRPISLGASLGTKSGEFGSSSASETSEDDSDPESSVGESPEPSPLPPTRPDDPLAAVRYDTIKATWKPRNVPITPDQVRTAFAEYWNIINKIRIQWKSDKSDLEDLKKPDPKDVQLLEARIEHQRNLMERAMRSAIEYGHPDVIKVFGGEAGSVALLYQFLNDRYQTGVYNDSFSETILELLSRSEHLRIDLMKRPNLHGLLIRFSCKNDEQIKALARKILRNVKDKSGESGLSQSKAGSLERSATKTDTVTPRPESSKRPQPPPLAGVKRARNGEGTTRPLAKKVAAAATTPRTTAAGARTAVSGLRTLGSTKTTSGAPSTVPNPKSVIKPKIFTGLQSASKRSSPTPLKPTNAVPAAPKQVASSASVPRFSFSETMANLTKPKEKRPIPKLEEVRPLETEEEKARRTRKEERRKLRVKWADGGIGNKGQLESVHLFTHDPEEEAGHDAALVRDVGDVGREGRMFKQHKDMMDVDDDDDRLNDDPRSWHTPSLVDFSSVPDAERERNYAPYGGGKLSVDSEETLVQQQRESNTLMAIYYSPDDIPACPRDPPEEEQGHSSAKPPWIGIPPPNDSPYTCRAAALAAEGIPMPDLDRIRSIINQTQQPQPEPQTSELEKTFLRFVASQPSPLVSQGYPEAPAAPAAADIQAILASLDSLQQPGPAMQPSQILHQAPIAAPSYTSMNNDSASSLDLAAMLQSVRNDGASHPTSAFSMPALDQKAQHPDTHRPLHSQQGKPSRGTSNNKNKKWKNNPDYQPPQFVVPCKFWKEGKCIKGDKCPVHSSPSSSQRTAAPSPPRSAPTAPKSMVVPPQSGASKKRKKRRKSKRNKWYTDRDANGGLGTGTMGD